MFSRRAVALVSSALFALSGCGQRAGGFEFSGTLQAPSAAVGSTVGGRVTAVLVDDGAPVRAGDVLVRFDDLQQRAALRAATGRVAQAEAALEDLNAGARAPDLARAQALALQQREAYENVSQAQPRQIAVLEAQLHQAEAQEADAAAALKQARADAARTRTLYATGDESAQERDVADERESRAAAQVADTAAGVRAARNQLANARDVTLPKDAAAALASYRAAQQAYQSLAVGARPDQVRQARALLASARADVSAARARLAETVVLSPAAGVVNGTDLHVGDLVAAGAPVATIDEYGEPYVRVYVPQSALGRIRLGLPVRVRSDADPGTTFPGSVEQIDAQAQFTPQNVQTAEDRANLSFGVKVRVHDRSGRLRGGTTVDVAFP